MTSLQHLALLKRFNRSFNLREAIRRSVTKGDHVLDAGCGVGLLSFWAAKAGASSVLGVDLELPPSARQLAKENSLDSIVTFRQEDLWTLPAPAENERVDVLIAMLYLNDPRRDEAQARLACKVHDSWLRTGGVSIPDRITYTMLLLEWPEHDWGNRIASLNKDVDTLEGYYGLSLSALKKGISHHPDKAQFPFRSTDGCIQRPAARVLSEGSTFHEFRYGDADFKYPEAVNHSVGRTGTAHVVLWTQKLWFEELLLFANESISWLNPSHPVKAGEDIQLSFGDAWRTSNTVRSMKLSTGPAAED